MKPGERPLLFGRTDAFEMDTRDPETIIVTNRTQLWTPFVLVVVPDVLAGVAVLPWRRIIDEFSKPGGPARLGNALLTQLLGPAPPEEP
jgi:hypothetical protein